MKIAITGATGFFGSHLVKSFVKQGYEVIALKRSFSDTSRIENFLEHIQTYDVDRISLNKIFQENHVDVVIHAATNYGKGNASYSQVMDANVMFPLQMIEALGSVGQPTTFINTDTFFNNSKFNSYNYLNAYGLSKKYFIELAEKYVQNNVTEIQLINVKLEHLYGPLDDNSKFVMSIINDLLNNEPNINLTKGDQQRDFIYVEDAVKAYACIIEQRSRLERISSFELGTGVATSIRHFVDLAKEVIGSNTYLNYGGLPNRDNEILYSRAECSGLHNLGWNSTVTIKEGIENLVSSMRGVKDEKGINLLYSSRF